MQKISYENILFLGSNSVKVRAKNDIFAHCSTNWNVQTLSSNMIRIEMRDQRIRIIAEEIQSMKIRLELFPAMKKKMATSRLDND